MPQDSVRSAVYRSLRKSLQVTNEDSNEISMYETNRKSKTNSTLNFPRNLVGRNRIPSENPASSMNHDEEEKAKAFTGAATSPLREVSQGVKRLNEMVDSWPKGREFDEWSRDVANDLLRGASDLRESLIMLEKLQKEYKRQIKKTREPKAGKEAQISIERRGNSGDRLQSPRASVDDSSGKRIEELKKVIQESLHRQNLLPLPADNGKGSSGRSNFNSISDGYRASSSPLLLVPGNRHEDLCCERKPRAGNSYAAASSQIRKKPNVIAKLMGLEDFPSEPVLNVKRQCENNKLPHTNRPRFDIDMPKTGKMQSTDQNRDPDRKTLKEIIDTMQFKGLLKSKYCDDHETLSYFSGTSFRSGEASSLCEDSMGDNLPPIVIIKPLHIPRSEREKLESPKSIQKEELSNSERKPQKRAGKEHDILEAIVHEREFEDPVRMTEKSREMKDPNNQTVALADGVSKSKQPPREREKIKIVEVEDEYTAKNKASVKHPGKQKKKEAIKTCKRDDEVQKTLADRAKWENTKSVTTLKSQVKANCLKLNKPERTVPIKNHYTCQTSASQNHKSVPYIPVPKNSVSQLKRKQTKKEKQDRESSAVNLITEDVLCKDEKEITAVSSLDINFHSDNASALFEDLSTQSELEEATIEESSPEELNSTSIVASDVQYRESDECAKEASLFDDDKSKVQDSVKIRQLLLSSPSFISCADEIFDLRIDELTFLSNEGIENETWNSRLILDCANELMTHKCHKIGHKKHPLNHLSGSQVTISLDCLVEELIDGIEKLRVYGEIGDDGLSADRLILILEKDLRCKEIFGYGVWDLGWVNGLSMSDAEQVVNEVQKHVVSDVLEEIIIEILQ